MHDYTQTLLTDLHKVSATISTSITNTDTGSAAPDPDTEAKEATDKAVHEILRAGGGKLHNIAALMGGMVAQKVIKVVMKQYIPMDNMCVFNGITSHIAVFRT